ncbi:hypothetical protein [Pseudochrobactrum kiredjianiae]|uniref:Uncharacterized protein n=1 Tax=Pseudochrobactrum kiredjianiae TaxID=386305 RepID=A0ABW3V3G1_9HYPH|nr:hypothetical protein [Pseudochrobactrum kiredjianiae]MDM7853202.1 hypothetical protein [Pseudochrobactrum kiredjianiae]
MNNITSIKLQPLEPIITNFNNVLELFCDDKYSVLYALSSDGPINGLLKIDLDQPKNMACYPGVFFTNSERKPISPKPFACDYENNELFINLEDQFGSFVFCTNLRKKVDSGIPLMSRITPPSGETTSGPVIYDSKRKRLYVVEQNPTPRINVYYNRGKNYMYSIDLGDPIHDDVASMVLDEKTETLYFNNGFGGDSILKYFSVSGQGQPKINQIVFPYNGKFFGNRIIHDVEKYKIFVPIIADSADDNPNDTQYGVLVIDTVSNQTIKFITFSDVFDDYIYLTLDPVRGVLFALTSSWGGDLYVAPINTDTLDYTDIYSTTVPGDNNGFFGFTIHVGETKDTLYCISNLHENMIMPIDITFGDTDN